MRTLTALGRSLPFEPITGMTTVARRPWLLPVGAAFVTGLVVFAIGGVVVRGLRSAESTPVVTAAEVAPASAAPSAVALSEVVKPKPSPASTPPEKKPVEGADARPAQEPADGSANAGTTSPGARTTTASPGANHRSAGQPSEKPETRASTADYLPGTL